MTARVEAILFDKDGTLFDFSKSWEAWASAILDRLAEDADHVSRLGAAIGFDPVTGRFESDSLVIAGTPFEVARALLPHLPTRDLLETVTLLNAEASRAPQVPAVPLLPLFSELKNKGLRLGVATNDAEAPARAHLDGAGVLDVFHFVAGCDSGYGSKPAPGQLLAFAAELRLGPHACVMVGDSRHDLGAGRAAGFRTVGVLTGMAAASDLTDLADVILPDIGHLPQWLATL